MTGVKHEFTKVVSPVEAEEPHAVAPKFPNVRDFVAVSFSFIDDDLVVFIESDIAAFLYGDGFADYAYTPDKVAARPGILKPIVIQNARPVVMQTLRVYYDRVRFSPPEPEQYERWIASLSDLLAVPMIWDRVVESRKTNGLSLQDIHLLFIPDGVLYRVPFGMLRCAPGSPLYSRVASVSMATSLLSLKWQVGRYLWMCRPWISADSLRLVFFGVPQSEAAPGAPYLSAVSDEWAALNQVFSPAKALGFGNAEAPHGFASCDYFATYHQDADIVWYAGHGVEEFTRSIGSPLKDIPQQGITLVDGLLTAENFRRGTPWNFSHNFITVLNSCLLGTLYEDGLEVVGLLSSLYMVNISAVVSALWTIDDSIACAFAREFASQLVQAVREAPPEGIEWVRGRAFNNTIQTLSQSYDEWDLAPYSYFGVP